MPKLPKSLLTVIIEHVEPELDGGRYPIKRIVGETLEVTADIFKEGHDTIAGILRYKVHGEKQWQEVPMHHVDNDRWAGSFVLSENTRYLYTIGAYIKSFETWRAELTKKHGVVPDLSSELLEGEAQLKDAMNQAKGADATLLKEWLGKWDAASSQEARIAIALDDELATLVSLNEQRAAWSTYPQELAVVVDRKRARYGAWWRLV
jgi:starch synthase (maltosyl-transferring)